MPKKTDKGQEHTKTDPGIARKGDFIVVKRQMRVGATTGEYETYLDYEQRYMVLRVLKADRKGIAQNFAEQHEWSAEHKASTGNTRFGKGHFQGLYNRGVWQAYGTQHAHGQRPFDERLDEMRAEIRKAIGG